MFNVIEKFISIDGEGPTAGELAVFIRFLGCNLRCKWCDTTYSWDGSTQSQHLSTEEIYQFIKNSQCQNVTLTGGEPLIQKGIEELLDVLAQDESLTVHIETNGAIDIQRFKQRYKNTNIHFILDYKCGASGMSHKNCLENMAVIDSQDVYKFVVASQEDLDETRRVIESHQLVKKCAVYLSPVVDSLKAEAVVEFMKEHRLTDVKLQLQLHKYIWPQEMRGV